MMGCLKAAALLALVATAAGQSPINLDGLDSPARRSTTNSTNSTLNLYQSPCGSGDGAGGETVYYLDIEPGWG